MRSFIGAVVLFALACGITIAADASQAEAIKLIDKLKGKHKDAKKGETVLTVDLGRKKVTDADLKVLSSLTTVRELNLGGTVLKEQAGKTIYAPSGITDEGIKNIAGFQDLRKLQLDGAGITDAGLKHLAGLKNLTDLTLTGTKVTDAGMAELVKIPKLQTLFLFDTKVTESGVGVLKRGKPDLKISK